MKHILIMVLTAVVAVLSVLLYTSFTHNQQLQVVINKVSRDRSDYLLQRTYAHKYIKEHCDEQN